MSQGFGHSAVSYMKVITVWPIPNIVGGPPDFFLYRQSAETPKLCPRVVYSHAYTVTVESSFWLLNYMYLWTDALLSVMQVSRSFRYYFKYSQ